jgi:predicted GIY-YIG superfamily endonuclease
MYYVYIIKSLRFPDKKYIGITTNIKTRLYYHNNSLSVHTSKFKPWTLNICLIFRDKDKAVNFEKYLKSGSGRAFSKNHF